MFEEPNGSSNTTTSQWRKSRLAFPSLVVRPQKQTISKWTKAPAWQWKGEKHYNKQTNELLPTWHAWHKAGTYFRHAVRYSNGFHGRKDCLFVLSPAAAKAAATTSATTTKQILSECDKLTIPHGRYHVYFKTYAALVRADPFYQTLEERLARGENLQICEVDGPPVANTKKVEAPFQHVVNGSIHVDEEVATTWLKAVFHLDMESVWQSPWWMVTIGLKPLSKIQIYW